MNELMSPNAFKWALTILTGGFAGLWVLVDLRNLARSRNHDRSDAVVRDRHFGYVIGILVGIVGVVGCLKFHGVV